MADLGTTKLVRPYIA